MKPKMWLPCVLKKMVSPPNGQAHNNGSFGLELLWPNDKIFTGEKWIYPTCSISQTQKTLFEMCRLIFCLVLISASMENMTLKAVLFLLTKLRFFHSVSFLPFPFQGYICFLSQWFMLLHGLQYCYTEVFLYILVLFWLSQDDKLAFMWLRGFNLMSRKT